MCVCLRVQLSAIKIDPIPRQQKVQDDPDGHLLYRESDVILERCKRNLSIIHGVVSLFMDARSP